MTKITLDTNLEALVLQHFLDRDDLARFFDRRLSLTALVNIN